MIQYESDRLRNGSELYYSQEREDLSCEPHLHDSFELTIVSGGCVEATIGSTVYLLQQGDAVLIFPNQIHAYRTPTASQSYVCIFPSRLVGEFYQKVRDQEAVSPVFRPGDPAISQQLQSAEKNRYLLKSQLYRLIYLFDRDAQYRSRGTRGLDLLEKVLSLISQRYAEPITMRLLARELGYDHRYLSNLMQKGLHTTFRRLLNEYRISHAQYLLSTTDTSIEMIAEECGYDSLCTFNRNFRDISAVTPSQWRQQHQISGGK